MISPRLSGLVLEELERVRASEQFAQAPVLEGFLTFVVTETLEGRPVKESNIAAAVFKRGSDFNPKTDPIVRVNARLVRAKLAEYYGGPGRLTPLRIEIPVGRYSPDFLEPSVAEPAQPPEPVQPPPEPPPPRRKRLLAGALALASLGAAGGVIATRRGIGPAPGPDGMRALTMDIGESSDPSWSANGRWMAYSSNRAGQSRDIWIEDRSQPDSALRLTDHPAHELTPDVHPDGSEVVYRSHRDGGGIYAVKTTGGAERLLAPGGFGPRYSPDGARLAYVASDGDKMAAHVLDLGSGRTHRVAPRVSSVLCPTWLPSGRSILYHGFDPIARRADWLLSPVDFDGPPDQWPVTPSGAADMGPPRGLFVKNQTCPDTVLEDQIIFSSWGQLWSIPFQGNRAGTSPRSLATGPGLASVRARRDADGRLALLFYAARGEGHFWSLPLDPETHQAKGPLTRVSTTLEIRGGLNGTRPALSLDGRWLYYQTHAGRGVDIVRQDLNRPEPPVRVVDTAAYESDVMAGQGEFFAYERSVDKTCLFYVKEPESPERLVCRDCGYPHSMAATAGTLLFLVDGKFHTVDPRSGQKRILPGNYRGTVYGALSPDGQWAALGVNRSGGGMQGIVLNTTTPSAQPMQITTEPYNLNLAWTADGNGLFFLSQSDGRRCLYLQRLHPATKQPAGPLEAVHHFHDAIGPYPWNGAWMAAARGRLIMNLGQNRANVWTLRVPDK